MRPGGTVRCTDRRTGLCVLPGHDPCQRVQHQHEPSATGVYTSTAVPVDFNLALNDRGQLSLAKPTNWTGQRASMGELQLSQGEVVQATIGLMTALKEYDNYVKDIQIYAQVISTQFGIAVDKLELMDDRRDEKILFQHEIFHHQRFLIQFSVGSLPHPGIMKSIELFGTKVAPVVRKELASRAAAGARTAEAVN